MRLVDLRGVKKLRPVPLDMCTIDHLDPKWHPLRGKFNGELRKVVACNACNSARDQAQLRAVPVILLRAAAERGIKAPLLARAHASILAQVFPLLPSPGAPRRRLKVTFESEGETQNDD